MTTITTGYVTCNYTDGDTLGEVEHGEIRVTPEEAADDARFGALCPPPCDERSGPKRRRRP
jgi:hypothetical protein